MSLPSVSNATNNPQGLGSFSTRADSIYGPMGALIQCEELDLA
jgi:hypothetical protein